MVAVVVLVVVVVMVAVALKRTLSRALPGRCHRGQGDRVQGQAHEPGRPARPSTAGSKWRRKSNTCPAQSNTGVFKQHTGASIEFKDRLMNLGASVTFVLKWRRITILCCYTYTRLHPRRTRSWFKMAPKIKHGRFPTKHWRFPIEHGHFPIKHGRVPSNTGTFQ